MWDATQKVHLWCRVWCYSKNDQGWKQHLNLPMKTTGSCRLKSHMSVKALTKIRTKFTIRTHHHINLDNYKLWSEHNVYLTRHRFNRENKTHGVTSDISRIMEKVPPVFFWHGDILTCTHKTTLFYTSQTTKNKQTTTKKPPNKQNKKTHAARLPKIKLPRTPCVDNRRHHWTRLQRCKCSTVYSLWYIYKKNKLLRWECLYTHISQPVSFI